MTRLFLAAAALVASAAASCGAPARETSRPAPPADPAIALFERRVAADPRDHLSATTLAQLHLRRADALGAPDEFRLAEAAARTALDREPTHLAAKVALARALLGEGRADEARRIVWKILDEQPRNVGALETAFDEAFVAGDDKTAAVYAERLLAINEEPGTLSRLGKLAQRRGDRAGAAELFRRAAASARDLGGMADEIDGYRRLEALAAGGTR